MSNGPMNATSGDMVGGCPWPQAAIDYAKELKDTRGKAFSLWRSIQAIGEIKDFIVCLRGHVMMSFAPGESPEELDDVPNISAPKLFKELDEFKAENSSQVMAATEDAKAFGPAEIALFLQLAKFIWGFINRKKK